MTFDDMLVEILRALPAKSAKHLAIKAGLTCGQVRGSLVYLARHSAEYRWQCAHVSRGRTNDYKYYAILFDKQGRMIAPKEGQTFSHIQGMYETLKTHMTQAIRQARVHRAFAANYYGDRDLKRMLNDIALDQEQRAQRISSVLEYISEIMEDAKV